MKVHEILEWRLPRLITITPDASVSEAADLLTKEQIGAVVVISEPAGIAGIISERDIVHAISKNRGAVLDRPVSDYMTEEVITCSPSSNVEALARDMTENRIRHLPVLDDDNKLVGVVSIGDLVKHRVDELEAAR